MTAPIVKTIWLVIGFERHITSPSSVQNLMKSSWWSRLSVHFSCKFYTFFSKISTFISTTFLIQMALVSLQVALNVRVTMHIYW